MNELPESGHHPHGPSSAHRWLICTDSPFAEAEYPDETTDPADEGTAAHWFAESCLQSGNDAQVFRDNGADTGLVTRGSEIIIPAEVSGCEKDWPVTGEMVEAVQVYIDEINKHAKKRGTKTFIEEKVHLAENYGLDYPVGGTADAIMYLPRSKTLAVRDLKYGRHVVVEVGDDKFVVNPQAGIYGLASLAEIVRLIGKQVEVKKLDIGIVQPRAYHKKGPVRNIIVELFDLIDLEIAIAEAVNGPRVRVAGEHCRFCKAKDDCETYAEWRAGENTSGFEAEVPDTSKKDVAVSQVPVSELPLSKPVKGLTLQELGVARASIRFLKDWVKEVEEEVRTRLLYDMEVPGWRLAPGRGSRSYGGSPEEVEQAAKATIEEKGLDPDLLYSPRVLRSPAQLEKEFGKGAFKNTPLGQLVTTTEGGPTVVGSDSDKPDYVKDNGFEGEVPPADDDGNSLL